MAENAACTNINFKTIKLIIMLIVLKSFIWFKKAIRARGRNIEQQQFQSKTNCFPSWQCQVAYVNSNSTEIKLRTFHTTLMRFYLSFFFFLFSLLFFRKIRNKKRKIYDLVKFQIFLLVFFFCCQYIFMHS